MSCADHHRWISAQPILESKKAGSFLRSGHRTGHFEEDKFRRDLYPGDLSPGCPGGRMRLVAWGLEILIRSLFS
jgi:hypothetical protein